MLRAEPFFAAAACTFAAPGQSLALSRIAASTLSPGILCLAERYSAHLRGLAELVERAAELALAELH